MINNYSPSVNIVRDLEKQIDYLPTPNTIHLYNLIINNIHSGIHSFNIIGSYGTGKSSFIWAFEKQLNKKQQLFASANNSKIEAISFEYFPIVGSYSSLSIVFSELLQCKGKETAGEIVKCLSEYYENLKKQKKGLLIAIDEFGKFLEYATKNNPENELYFIQQLAEFINNNDNNIILITALHQNFTSYSYGLSRSQINEWDKVKGRFKEITFNEPVEQLLLLASKRINSKNENKAISPLFEEIRKANIFPLKDYFNIDFAKSIQPFDILSAAILTKALQRYGQNERSLFQFIEINDYWGLNDYDKKNNPFYNISCVYDYLIHNNYSFISSKYNPDYTKWINMNTSLDRVQSIFKEDIDGYIKIIKTIGLLNLLGEANGIMTQEFLYKYSKIALGINDPNILISNLEKYKIISFSKFYNRYRLVGGSDIDIEAELLEAELDGDEDMENLLQRNISLPYIMAKEHFYTTGTPRFFSYKFTEEPITSNQQDTDGVINIVFSDNLSSDDFKEASMNTNDAILYCKYNDYISIKNALIDIEKIKIVINKYRDDKIVQDDLKILLNDSKSKFIKTFINNLASGSSNLNWFFQGNNVLIKNYKSLNKYLSFICNVIYFGTPIQQNELINKSKLSGAIQTAKKAFLQHLVEYYSEEELGFSKDNFPPQKTIYLTLLSITGIHKNGSLHRPKDKSYDVLWLKCIEFLQEAKTSRMSPEILVDRLKDKPFGLKQGFIDFWLPVFLFINRDDYALFQDGIYIPDVDIDAIDLISKKPHLFEIKSFDVSGIKLELYQAYQEFLNIETEEYITNEKLIEIIKPFLVFYASLPEYSKKTKRLSKNAILFREAIKHSKDPEKTFFEDIPYALGYNLNIIVKSASKVADFIKTLQSYVKEIRTSYEALINRIEKFLISDFVGKEVQFPDYRTILQQRFKHLKKAMLTPAQSIFYQRLMSGLDIRNAWISSLAQSLISKSLDAIDDKDEIVLYERFKDMIEDLDNLCTLAKSEIDIEHEDLFKLEITSLSKGHQKQFLRIPKEKIKLLSDIEEEIKSRLTSDKSSNIALLIKLLQEQIENE